MLLQLGRVPTLVVSSAAAAREVLLVHDHAFANRPSLAVPTRLLYGCTDIAFAPNGAYWRRARKLAVLHLLSPARVRAYRRVREEEVSELVRKVEEEQKLHGVVRLSELLSGFAKDVNGRIVLGVRASGGTGWRSKVDALMEEANALLGAFHVGDYFPWLAWLAAVDGTDAKVGRAFERIDQILEEIIVAAGSADEMRDGRADGAPCGDEAFVHVLLSLQSDSVGHGWRFSRDNVKALLEVKELHACSNCFTLF
jgi:cytochrome P450 family 1 subfamily D